MWRYVAGDNQPDRPARIVGAGQYPTRAALARWSGSSIIEGHPDAGNCCSGGYCG